MGSCTAAVSQCSCNQERSRCCLLLCTGSLLGPGVEKSAGKIKSPHLTAVQSCIWGISNNRLEDDFTHPRVGQAERLACRERQPTRFPGGSPDPLYLQRKKMLRCLYTPRKEIPPCCPCATLCETIGYRAPVVPANQDVAAEGPLQAKDKTRKRMSKGLPYFPFQRRIFSL